MRVLGFSKHWQKLSNSEFTTFRFPRKDKDWQVGEVVQVVFKPRSKEREVLGMATIAEKCPKLLHTVTEKEAREDGFEEWIDMFNWLRTHYPIKKLQEEAMNKLTLKWIDTQR